MSLVSPSDFVIDINIPNTDETPIIEVLQGFINKYEPKYLTSLLGPVLYSDFKAGIELEPIPAKWVNLKDAISIEQIASFVYWYFVRKQSGYLSGMNVIVRPKSENAVNASPIDDMVNVWNEMVDSSFKSAKFIQDNNVDYGNYYNRAVFSYLYFGSCGALRLPDIFYSQNKHGL